jgi:hypothetical protein
MTSENRHELKVLVLDAVMERAIHLFGPRYEKDPRVLAVGPAVRDSDFGAVGSAPVKTLIPDIVENIFGCGVAFLRTISLTASRITSRNASVFWESGVRRLSAVPTQAGTSKTAG